MPTIPTGEAAERLAAAVEKSKPGLVGVVYDELYPEVPPTAPPTASGLAAEIRGGLEPEAIVDLWNVVFPEDRNVRYVEEAESISYNEEAVEYAD